CLTAAFELALGCDLLLAARSARFGLVETVVGLTPAMGGTQRLAERAGPARSPTASRRAPPARTPPRRRSYAPPYRAAAPTPPTRASPSSRAPCSTPR